MTRHRIFISKGTLDMGRGRSIRKLEAQLDGQQNAGRLSESHKPLKEDTSSSISADTYLQGKNEKRSLLAESQESRSIAGEEHLQQYMPDIADNHPAHTLGENSISLNTLLLPTSQEKLLFCDYLSNPCQNRVCFTNKYCGLKSFLDRKQKAKNLGYNWSYNVKS